MPNKELKTVTVFIRNTYRTPIEVMQALESIGCGMVSAVSEKSTQSDIAVYGIHEGIQKEAP